MLKGATVLILHKTIIKTFKMTYILHYSQRFFFPERVFFLEERAAQKLSQPFISISLFSCLFLA